MMLMPNDSPKRQHQALQQIKKQLTCVGLQELMIYLRFNSGQLLLLSTHEPLMAISSKEKKSLMDADFSLQLLTDRYQFLDAITRPRHHAIERELDARFQLYRPYCFLRCGVECDFMVSVLSHLPVIDGSAIYEKTVIKVERAAMALLQAEKSLIFAAMPSYRQAIIFNNLHVLSHVLQKRTKKSMLTKREKACLTMALMGKAIQEVALLWGVSEGTIKSHHAHIREKLGCYTLLEAAMMAFYFGEIGCLPKQIRAH